MDYRSCLDYLYGLQHFGIKLGLENTRMLLELIGNPQRKLRIIHIAGTNGKGSTAATLEQVLRAAGLRTGLYTSPHLHCFCERIRIDNQAIDTAEIVRQTAEIRSHATGLKPTFFEFTTAMALRIFAQQEVDWVILETGLGGRLDSTNVVDPEICIITALALDHAAHLGGSLEEIAAEKGGIIKPGVPLVCARQKTEALQVLTRIAADKKASLYLAGRDFDWTPAPQTFAYRGLHLRLPQISAGLAGAYQRENISLALAAAELLEPSRLEREMLGRTLAALRWPGRLEWCGEVLLDGAHNPHAAEGLADYLAAEELHDLIWVAAFKADKDFAGILRPLLPHVAHLVAAPLQTEETWPAGELVAASHRSGVSAEACVSPEAALTRALELRRPGQKILVAGSLFLVAALRNRCQQFPGAAA